MRLQLEFKAWLDRKDGKLLVDAAAHREDAPKDTAPTVGSFLRHLDASVNSACELSFGSDFGPLLFVGVDCFGAWASVEFTQRIYRDVFGGMVVDEPFGEKMG